MASFLPPSLCQKRSGSPGKPSVFNQQGMPALFQRDGLQPSFSCISFRRSFPHGGGYLRAGLVAVFRIQQMRVVQPDERFSSLFRRGFHEEDVFPGFRNVQIELSFHAAVLPADALGGLRRQGNQGAGHFLFPEGRNRFCIIGPLGKGAAHRVGIIVNAPHSQHLVVHDGLHLFPFRRVL